MSRPKTSFAGIEKLLDDNGFNEVCADCEYYSETYQSHPYGMGTATETLGECACNFDEDCPRLNDEHTG